LPESTTLLHAAILGIVEGLTEFLPVSSTGHLILTGHLLGFAGPPGKVFEVVIQLGAILAVCALYHQRLLRLLLSLPYDPAARRFALAVLAAFLPAMVLGVLFHGTIKAVLFSPWVVVCTLITGGVLILLIENLRPVPRYHTVETLPVPLALKVGLCQAIAMASRARAPPSWAACCSASSARPRPSSPSSSPSRPCSPPRSMTSTRSARTWSPATCTPSRSGSSSPC
jgi:undecaprenyl pyrophosphate phosphatase UppP